MPAAQAQPIQVKPPRGGLLDRAERIPLAMTEWRYGVTAVPACGAPVQPWSCEFGQTPTPGQLKTFDSVGDAYTFKPFLPNAPQKCEGIVTELVREQALSRYERGLSAYFARELVEAPSLVGNESFVSVGTDITPATGPSSLVNTLYGLLEYLTGCGLYNGMIHMPIEALPRALSENLLEYLDGAYWLGGYQVVFDAYPNVGPAVLTNGTSPAPAANRWLWASGPVEVAYDESAEVMEWHDNQTNTHYAIAESLGILRFDPCCVAGAEAVVCS